MQETETLGLRDRKRIATRMRLEQAAVSIAAESGLDAVTIDAISERAEVSARTFFNYFDSKEDALLGAPIRDDTADRIAQAAASLRPAGVLEGILELITSTLEPPARDEQLRAARMRIVREHPELLHRKFLKIGTTMDALSHGALTIMQHLAQDGPAPTLPEAQIAVMMCASAVRGAYLDLAAFPGRIDDHAGAVRDRAARLISLTLERLS